MFWLTTVDIITIVVLINLGSCIVTKPQETMLVNMGKQKDQMQAFQLAFLQQEQQQTQAMLALLETVIKKYTLEYPCIQLIRVASFHSVHLIWTFYLCRDCIMLGSV